MEAFDNAWPFHAPEQGVYNQKTAAENNRRNILGLIARRRCLTQRELRQTTGLQASTIYNIVTALKKQGLVREGAQIIADRVGPKETELEIVPDCLWSAGIALDRQGHRLTLLNACGHTLASEDLPPGLPNERLIPTLAERIRRCAGAAGLTLETFGGAGISVPGVVDPVSGTVRISRSLGMKDFALSQPLSQALDGPVWVERNVSCGAYAEQTVGTAREQNSFIYFSLRLGTDRKPQMGMALVMAEKLFRGENSAAGEIESLFTRTPDGATPSEAPLTTDNTEAFYQTLARRLTAIVDILDINCVVFACNDESLSVERFRQLEHNLSEGLVPVPTRRVQLLRSSIGSNGILIGSALLALHRGLELYRAGQAE
ncbi:ROK family protein [Ruficoccus amylovorans]|uniref:ROK family protein n=1 Tax=Ruficoccus amylovorans TaxID=1804625 RepID=A0A842HLM0_9BACT|nr:ROK family transcriptional regulator [Ruficoccus amylovorans]MBC2596021.1 ROK family protein [Ruficoccus amylovorans]